MLSSELKKCSPTACIATFMSNYQPASAQFNQVDLTAQYIDPFHHLLIVSVLRQSIETPKYLCYFIHKDHLHPL